MADNAMVEKMYDELNLWAYRVANRIKDNFTKMHINRVAHGKYTGDLYRSIYWQVHKMAGGNKGRIEFFYEYYGRFVEMGVGNGFKKTEVPPMRGMNVIPIPGRKRVAKPFLTSEIRFHARWLAERLEEVFGVDAGLAIMRNFECGVNPKKGDPGQSKKWIEEHRHLIEKGETGLVEKTNAFISKKYK